MGSVVRYELSRCLKIVLIGQPIPDALPRWQRMQMHRSILATSEAKAATRSEGALRERSRKDQIPVNALPSIAFELNPRVAKLVKSFGLSENRQKF